MRISWLTEYTLYAFVALATIQLVNGQGFMQIHAGDSQPLTLSRPSSTPSTASLPPSIPYPMPNNTKLSGTAPLSGSGALSNGALPGYASITVGTAPPAIQTSSGYDPGAPRPASWSSEVLASQISASAWATNPGCTASWRSRVAANNGTVVTTQSWRYTAALNSTATTWLDVNHPVTGPTTTVFAPGAATYTIGDDDVCCGQCRIRYPLVRVYYWPVNSTNTWCMSLNPPTVAFSDGPATSSIVFAPPQSSNPLGLPTLTSSTNTMPTDLPKLPTLSPSGGDATVAGGLPTLSHSLDSATEVGLTGLPKLSSSFSSLNTATETVPAGLPKLTPRDISHVTPAPSLPSLPAELLRARSSIPLNHSQVYAVGPDGFIFTSPSVYVVVSTIFAWDKCHQKVGDVHTSLTLSFAQDELSTIDGISGDTMSFNFADLPCPPSSYSYDSTVPNPVMGNSKLLADLVHTYHPVILVPTASIRGLDPAWKSCAIVDVGNGYDPPRPMTPATGLWNNPTSSVGDPGATPTPAPQLSPSTPTPMSDPPPPPPTSSAQETPADLPTSKGGDPHLPTPSPVAPASPPTSNRGNPALSPKPSSQTSLLVLSNLPAHSSFSMASPAAHSSVPALVAPETPQSFSRSSSQAVPIIQPAPNTGDPAPPIDTSRTAPADPLTTASNPTPATSADPPSPNSGNSAMTNSPLILSGLTLTPAQPSAVPVVPVQPQTQPQPQSNAAPVTVGSLTFSPANPDPTPLQPPPVPAQSPSTPSVAGSFTFIPSPPVASPAPSNPAPVTAGGLTFFPVQPASNPSPVQPNPVPGQSAGPVSIAAQPNSPPGQASPVPVPSNPAIVQPNVPPKNPAPGNPTSSQPNLPLQSNPGQQSFAPAQPNPSTPWIVGGLTFATVSPATAPLVQGGQTIIPVQPNAPTAVPQISVSGQTVQTVPPGASEVVIGSGTVSVGSPPVVIGGTSVSFGVSSSVVGSNTMPLQVSSAAQLAPAPASVFPVGGGTFSGNPAAVSIDGTVLSQGAPSILISNTPVSLGPSGLVVGTSTVPIQNSPSIANSPSPVVTIGTQTFSASPTAFSVGGTVISQGAPGITVSNTLVSLGPSGLFIGTSTFPLQTPPPTTNPPLPLITIGSQTLIANPTAFSVAGTILSQGAPAITVSNTPISLGPSGLVIGASTIAIPTASTPSIPAPGVGNSPPNPSVFSVGGTTISSGGPGITISGTPVSFGPSGLIVGTSVMPLPSPSLANGGEAPGSAPLVYSVAGAALTQGGSAITLSGTQISLGPSGLVVGSSTVALSATATAPGINGQITAAGSSVYSIGGVALTQGGPAITISGTRISMGPSNVVIGSSTVNLPSSSLYTAAGQTFVPNPTGVSVAGTTLTPGGPGVTISGTPIYLGTSQLAIGSSTIPLPSVSPSPTFITVAGQSLTVNPTGFSIAGITLTPGGPGITISGTPVSLGTSQLAIGTSTIALSSSSPLSSVLTVAGQIFTANPTGFPIAGTTLTPGGSGITISGTPISLGSSDLVVGTTTITLPTKASVFTVDGEAFTATLGGLAIDGKTISPGGAGITVSGTPISLGTSALVFGNSTLPLSWSSPTQRPSVVSDSGSITPGSMATSTSAIKPTSTTHVGLAGKTEGTRITNLLYIMIACGIIWGFL